VKEKSDYNQEIRLYEPKSNIALGLFVAILCLGLGVLSPFLVTIQVRSEVPETCQNA